MNASTVTATADYDYRYVMYLLQEVFDKDTLSRSAVYTTAKGYFQRLDETKYKERSDKDRRI